MESPHEAFLVNKEGTVGAHEINPQLKMAPNDQGMAPTWTPQYRSRI